MKIMQLFLNIPDWRHAVPWNNPIEDVIKAILAELSYSIFRLFKAVSWHRDPQL